MTPGPPEEAEPSLRGAAAIFGLCLALIVAGRVATRRADDAATPLRPDLLVVHLAGLRADSIAPGGLAEAVGVPASSLVVFENAFAASSDPFRSAMSLLEGGLALDLGVQPSPSSLPRRLAAAGWSTALVTDDAALADLAGPAFSRVERAATADDLGPKSVVVQASAGQSPTLLVVHTRFGAEPLHADTTEAWMLRERYRLRVREVGLALQSVVRAALRPGRPTIVAIVGASGLELGEHPEDPEAPHDPQLRVPFVLTLVDGAGLPGAVHDALVHTPDLTPTLVAMLDLPPGPEGEGRSLEPLIHGWKTEPVHSDLLLAGPRHYVLRSADWKLVVPAREGRLFDADAARLFALGEDPEERRDLLLGEARPGPRARAMLSAMQVRLGQDGGRR